MYSGVIGRYYQSDRNSWFYKLDEVKENSVLLAQGEPKKLIEVSVIDFQKWIDCKHEMYVRQVGEVTLPFPDEDC